MRAVAPIAVACLAAACAKAQFTGFPIENAEGSRPQKSSLRGDQRFAALKSWIEANGGLVNFYIGKNANGLRGAFAASDLRKGQPSLILPPACIIASGRVLPEFPELDDLTKLALFLLMEKRNATTFWKPYLDLLPSFQELSKFHPLAQDDETLALLASSIGSQKAIIKELQLGDIVLHPSRLFIVYDSDKIRLDAVLAKNPGFSAEMVFSRKEYVAMYINVASRMFGTESPGLHCYAKDSPNGDFGEYLVLPGHDLLNHKTFTPLPDCSSRPDRMPLETIHSLPDNVRAGEELFEGYFDGEKCNHNVLISYGFLNENSKKENHDCLDFNEASIQVLISPNFPLRKEAFRQTLKTHLDSSEGKIASVWEKLIGGQIVVFGAGAAGKIDFVYNLFRLIVLSDEEFSRHATQGDPDDLVIRSVVNFRSEMSVLSGVLGLVLYLEQELHSFVCNNWPFKYVPLLELKRGEARAVVAHKRELYDRVVSLIRGYPGNADTSSTRQEDDNAVREFRERFYAPLSSPCVHLDLLALPDDMAESN